MKLRPTDRKLLDALVDAAGERYWQQDLGVGSAVSRAEEHFDVVIARMERRLKRPLLPRKTKTVAAQ